MAEEKESVRERVEGEFKSVAAKLDLGGKGGKKPEYGKPDRKGFVGTHSDYANAANNTDRPLAASDEGEQASRPTVETTSTPQPVQESGAGAAEPGQSAGQPQAQAQPATAQPAAQPAQPVTKQS